MSSVIDNNLVEEHNTSADHDANFDSLATRLSRDGHDVDALLNRAQAFGVAVPSWGVGTGGTRFARFPGAGEPRHVFDKLDDCGVIQQLTRTTPTVSLHIPWDDEDPTALREQADSLGLGFDAMNSNTFQDQTDQAHSYKHGSLSHVSAATRDQAIEHNLHCIEVGKAIGSKALTVWVGDGSNFPGQTDMGAQFDRYLDAMRSIYTYRLFLVFNELIEAERRVDNFAPAYMLDQSHNVTDPIESLMNSAIEVQRTMR